MENVICFGDSITASKPFAEDRRWTAVLQAKLNELAPERFAVFNRGVGGHHTADGLARYEADVLPHLPGTVVLEFGFNDASFIPGRHIARVPLPAFVINLTEMIRLVRLSGGKPILIANHPMDPSRPSPQGNDQLYFHNYAPYQVAIRQVAADTGTPLIDLEVAFADLPLSEFLSEDGLHLSVEGNRTYALAVLEGLKPHLCLG